jgi:hypothetical protein
MTTVRAKCRVIIAKAAGISAAAAAPDTIARRVRLSVERGRVPACLRDSPTLKL